MAAFAKSLGFEHLCLAGLPLPVILRSALPLSDEELIAFSRQNRPYCIERNVNGELEITSPAGSRGAYREAYVIRALGVWAEEHGGAYFSSNGGFTLPDSAMRSPAAAWIAQDRWKSLSEVERAKYAPVCPDFIIEILSESDSRTVIEAKMEIWIENGAQLAWMIDPFAAEVLIHRPGAEVKRIEHPDCVEANEVVPGFRLETTRLWAK